jgi:hypothetical protein
MRTDFAGAGSLAGADEDGSEAGLDALGTEAATGADASDAAVIGVAETIGLALAVVTG